MRTCNPTDRATNELHQQEPLAGELPCRPRTDLLNFELQLGLTEIEADYCGVIYGTSNGVHSGGTGRKRAEVRCWCFGGFGMASRLCFGAVSDRGFSCVLELIRDCLVAEFAASFTSVLGLKFGPFFSSLFSSFLSYFWGSFVCVFYGRTYGIFWDGFIAGFWVKNLQLSWIFLLPF